eukprot:GHVN01046232.1.p1 GENE.GHVN01046232.1~~GHVN01046232.1.p1  ORF type:complete len:214 (-),score=9.87 GHVN01046232.1:1085-1726(-)
MIVLLETIKHRNLHLASSSSVYGLNTMVPFSETDPVLMPVSLYGATKRSDELIAHLYHNLYDQSSVGLRFFTVYGPWGRPDMAYFSFTGRITRGDQIKMFNHGNMERDFTYIDDVVDGVVASLSLKPQQPEVINLGNNSPVKLKRFIAMLEEAIGSKANILSVDMQPGEVLRFYADIEKAKKLLGYSPQTSLEVGISEFVKWFKAEDGGRFLP